MKKTKFYCYSSQLRDFFRLKRIGYVYSFRHYNGNMCWVYNKTPEVCQALQEWDEFKKKNWEQFD